MVNPDFDWERLFELRVVPLVMAMLAKRPEKIIIILDRENRVVCPPELASRGLAVITARCGYSLGACELTLVISDKNFECMLFADYSAVDRLRILRARISQSFPATTDGVGVLSWIKHALNPGASYHKIRDGMNLASHGEFMLPEVQQRSRSLRKLMHELSTN